MLAVTALWLLLICVGWLVTRQLIDYAHRRELLDIANHRSSHTQATPRIGGVSFVLVISLLLISSNLYLPDLGTTHYLYIFIPCLLVALTGLADDVWGLKQRWRFVLYLLSGLLTTANLHAAWVLPFWMAVICIILLTLCISWLINLFNFMDGIDGIAASEALFVLAALGGFYWQQGLHHWGLILFLCTAPVIGFLILNWQPARIFMGDIGSTFLGCLIGCVLLKAVNDGILSPYSAILLPGTFLVDASWTLAYRLFSGQRWYAAHRSHHYQILSRQLKSHKSVTLLYGVTNLAWLLPMAWIATLYPQHGPLIMAISLLPLIFRCFIIGAGEAARN